MLCGSFAGVELVRRRRGETVLVGNRWDVTGEIVDAAVCVIDEKQG